MSLYARPCGIVGTLVDAMAPGSYLIVSYGSPDFVSPEEAAQDAVCTSRRPRRCCVPAPQIESFPVGLEPVEPGLVQLPYWRQDGIVLPTLDRISAYAAVARKPDAAGPSHAPDVRSRPVGAGRRTAGAA